MENIQVVYKSIGSKFGKTYYHKFIVYTDKNGNGYAASGWAGKMGIGLNGDYGNLYTTHGVYDQNYPDHPDNINNIGNNRKYVSEVVATGEDLSSSWKNIEKAMDDISNEQYKYKPMSQNSNSAADEALRRAGLPESKYGDWADPWAPGSNIPLDPKNPNGDGKTSGLPWGEIWDDWTDSYDDLSDWQDPVSRDNKAHAYAPLALDLNGDGIIQTTAVSGFSGSLFDHNNDGIRTATGWISKDDGLLVRDLNGNGLIDNGSELFGDHTQLVNGQNATHGYAALAELDSNHDNLINQADELFSSLKVWQDINQDGISQADELFTLNALGIQSLNLEYQETNQDLGNGNRLTHIGSYTKTDGTTGEMGDFILANNNLYSRYTDSIPLTDEQLQAPNLQGLGRLRDLREAAALSDELAQTLKAYATAQTKEAQIALLNELVEKWSATDPFKSDTDAFTLSSDLILTENEGIGLTPTQIAAWRNGMVLDTQTTADFAAVRGKIAVLDYLS